MAAIQASKPLGSPSYRWAGVPQPLVSFTVVSPGYCCTRLGCFDMASMMAKIDSNTYRWRAADAVVAAGASAGGVVAVVVCVVRFVV